MTRDLLNALRLLRKNPLFTIAVTAILTLGIGANTAVFSVVDAVLLRPLPYNSTRLIRIEETSTKRPMNGVPAQDYLYWSSRTDLFEATMPCLKDVATLTGIDTPDQVINVRTYSHLFSLLGVHPRLGRTLAASDENSAVLSDRMWRRLFHADPAILGRIITLSDEPFIVVGVMGPDFEFPFSGVDMWTPLRLTAASSNSLQVVARMKAGISVQQVQRAMDIVARQLEQQDSKKHAGLQIAVSTWTETPGREYELTLVFVLIAVGLVLLIACADVASLLLTRAVQRQKEIAIRASLGAGFWLVMRQLLAESLVLTGLGSAAGIVAAKYLLAFLAQQITALPIALPHTQRVGLNERVLLFNLGLCVILACIFSLVPVLLASRTDLQNILRGGQVSGASRSSTRLFSILIASEAAFAFLLLAGSGLMIRSLIRLQQADRGFHADHVLTIRVPIGTRTQPRPRGRYDTKPRQIAYYHELLERLGHLPGVRSIAVVNNLPLSGFSTSTPLKGADGQLTLVSTRTISPDYFSVMGIPLLSGRTFSEADQADSPRVVILNEYLARQLFPDRNPVGQNIAEPGSGTTTTVVGVVRNAAQLSYEQPAGAEIYLPYKQLVFGTFLSTFVVRTSGDPLALATALRKEVWAIDANQPITKIETMDDVIADSIWRPRFSAWIFSILGGLALLLTCFGVYGVVAYTTSLRVREVGIRVALGATPQNIIATVFRNAMMPLLSGLAISFVTALLLSSLLKSLLFEISNTDPLSYLGAGVLILLIGVVASTRPAWKAATGDALEALRTE